MQTWKTRFRRIAAMVCALALCASLLPAGALANNTDGIDVDESSSSQVVTGTEPTEEEKTEETGTETEQPAEAEVSTQSVEPTQTVSARSNEVLYADETDGITVQMGERLFDPVDPQKVTFVVKVEGDVKSTVTLENVYQTAAPLEISADGWNCNVYGDGVTVTDNVGEKLMTFIGKDEYTVNIEFTRPVKQIELRNTDGSIDLGTATYKTGGNQTTTFKIYLNYMEVCTIENASFLSRNAIDYGNFVYEGDYYLRYAEVLDSDLTAQTVVYYDSSDSLWFSNYAPAGHNTIALYFFNYTNGTNVDFSRWINDTIYSEPLFDGACDTLNISYNYGGVQTSYNYTNWGRIYLPNDTDITVVPTIGDGYYFEYWRDFDAGSENRLYSVLSNKEWVLDGQGTAHAGYLALTETLGMRFTDTDYPDMNICLYMTDGERDIVHHTVTYNSNYPADTGLTDESYEQHFYSTEGAQYGTRILDDMFKPEGYELICWTTQENGEGQKFMPDDLYGNEGSGDLTLYAQWEKVGTGEPEIPPLDEETLEELFDGKVKVECTTVNNHGYIMTGLLGNKAEQGNDYWVEEGTEGHATVHIANSTLYVEEYERQRDNGDHFYLADGSNVDIGLTYDKEANAWKIDADDEPYIKLTCNPGTTPTTPEKPGYDVISDLLEVRVTCLSGSIHDAVDYSVIPATGYVVGEVVANGDGTYSCEVTIPSKPYIEKYSEDTKLTHTGTTDKETRTLVATLEGNTWTWTLPNTGASSTVEFLTTCKPDEPTTDVVNTLDIDVKVYCKDNVHSDATYDLMPGYDIGDVTYNTSTGAYESRLTIHGTPYLTAYNEGVASGHTLFGDNEQYYMLTWNGTSWVKASTNPELYFQVTCKPDAPTPDEVDKLNLQGIALVACQNTSAGHKMGTYDLLKDSYTIGEVYLADDNTYKVNLTLIPDKYVSAYDNDTGAVHTGANAGFITLKYEDGAWERDGNGMVMFQVKCSTVTVPGDGGNNNDTPKDEHPDIAEGIANGTWGGTPTPTPAASATSTIPQTSDSMPIGLLAGTAAIAAAAIALLLVLRKRRQQ